MMTAKEAGGVRTIWPPDPTPNAFNPSFDRRGARLDHTHLRAPTIAPTDIDPGGKFVLAGATLTFDELDPEVGCVIAYLYAATWPPPMPTVVAMGVVSDPSAPVTLQTTQEAPLAALRFIGIVNVAAWRSWKTAYAGCHPQDGGGSTAGDGNTKS